jgi:hypothetical protein
MSRMPWGASNRALIPVRDVGKKSPKVSPDRGLATCFRNFRLISADLRDNRADYEKITPFMARLNDDNGD